MDNHQLDNHLYYGYDEQAVYALIYKYIHDLYLQVRIHSYCYKLCVNFSELLVFSVEDNSSMAFHTKFLRSTHQVCQKSSGQTIKKWLCWL